MRQVGTEPPVRDGTGNGMAVYARCGFEDLAPSVNVSSSWRVVRRGKVARFRGFALLRDPSLEVLLRIHVHAQEHFGVLHSAVLRALPEKNSRFVRIDPGMVHSIGNQVRLPRALRNPKTMIRD